MYAHRLSSSIEKEKDKVTPNMTSSGSSEEQSPSSTPMEGVEKSSSLLDTKALPQAKTKATMGAVLCAPIVVPHRVEPTVRASLQDEKEMEEDKKTPSCAPTW
jgi:hypothetical protein